MATLRLALCQLNPTVGDIAANEATIAAAIEGAREQGAGLALFGELAVTGYPPEDLLYKEHFLRDARAAIDRLARQSRGLVAIVATSAESIPPESPRTTCSNPFLAT